jgi:hypothetical protein
LLPPCGWLFWSALLTPVPEELLDESVEPDVAELPEVIDVPEEVEVDSPELVLVVLELFDVPLAFVEAWATPVIRPTVTAPAAVAAMVPARVARVRRRPFMAITIAAGASGPRHRKVKGFLKLAGR